MAIGDHPTAADPAKANSAEVTAGTDDAKFVTPKSLADSTPVFNGSGLTNLPASGLAVTEVWKFGPTDQVDSGSNVWGNDSNVSHVMNGLTFLADTGTPGVDFGPDGVTGIVIEQTAGSDNGILKIDLDDLATLGSHTREPGDLWLFDVCFTITNADDLAHLYTRPVTSPTTQLGFYQTSGTAMTLSPMGWSITHSMTIRRMQIQITDWGNTYEARCLVQDSATPSQDQADLKLFSAPQTSNNGSVIWIRGNATSSGGKITYTNIGIGVVPGGGSAPPLLSWDYSP